MLMPEPVRTQKDIRFLAYPVLVRVVSLVNLVNQLFDSFVLAIFFIFRKVLAIYRFFIGVCCPTLTVTSTGPAKDEQGSKMGTYEYYMQDKNGKEIFKHGDSYLFVDPHGYWAVRNITLDISLYIISFKTIAHYLFHIRHR